MRRDPDLFQQGWMKKRRSRIAMSDQRASADLAMEKMIEIQQQLWTQLLAIRRGKMGQGPEMTKEEREDRLFDMLNKMISVTDKDEPTYRCFLCQDRGYMLSTDEDTHITHGKKCSCLHLRISARKGKDADAAKMDFGPAPEEEDDAGTQELFP